MKTNNSVQMNKALKAFPLWNQLGTEQRAESLSNSLNALTGEARQMAQWQINNALTEIAAKQLMPGPTGESNLLSNQGRGVFVSQIDILGAKTESLLTALAGQVYAALIAGNSLIHISDVGQEFITKLASYLPMDVLQIADNEEQHTLIEDARLAGIASITNEQNEISLQEKLANKTGLLCQLITEKDLLNFSAQAQPRFIHKFTTEQTISTNTTAVGGNATLLELGSKTD